LGTCKVDEAGVRFLGRQTIRLAELESRVGKEGRRKFEKFLRDVGELDAEDEDEDVIDVTPK
jgi:hypothetical protein